MPTTENLPQDVVNPFIEDTIENPAALYDSYPLCTMTFDGLMLHGKTGGIVNYVWPSEGVWNGNKFTFHTGSYFERGVEIHYPEKPLMVDASSARAFMLVARAINEKNRQKLINLTEDHRGLFCGLVMDRLVWPNVGFGAR